MVEKPMSEWSIEDKRRNQLDYLARDILISTLEPEVLKAVRHCQSAKEIWEFLRDLCTETDQITRNKLQMLVDRYESFKMQDGEKVKDMESRFNSIIAEMATLGKKYPVAEMNSKVLSS